LKQTKVSIAKEYCEAIHKKHGLVTQELIIEYDKKHGKKLLTWNDQEAAAKFRIDEAAEWIAKIALEGQEGRAKRAYYNAIKTTETGSIRAYFAVEDIAMDEELYTSALAIYLAQATGLNEQFSHLKEARRVAQFIDREIKEPVTA